MGITISEGKDRTCPWCSRQVESSESHTYARKRYFHLKCYVAMRGQVRG